MIKILIFYFYNNNIKLENKYRFVFSLIQNLHITYQEVIFLRQLKYILPFYKTRKKYLCTNRKK